MLHRQWGCETRRRCGASASLRATGERYLRRAPASAGCHHCAALGARRGCLRACCTLGPQSLCRGAWWTTRVPLMWPQRQEQHLNVALSCLTTRSRHTAAAAVVTAESAKRSAKYAAAQRDPAGKFQLYESATIGHTFISSHLTRHRGPACVHTGHTMNAVAAARASVKWSRAQRNTQTYELRII